MESYFIHYCVHIRATALYVPPEQRIDACRIAHWENHENVNDNRRI
jgi:hypothetical protein